VLSRCTVYRILLARGSNGPHGTDIVPMRHLRMTLFSGVFQLVYSRERIFFLILMQQRRQQLCTSTADPAVLCADASPKQPSGIVRLPTDCLQLIYRYLSDEPSGGMSRILRRTIDLAGVDELLSSMPSQVLARGPRASKSVTKSNGKLGKPTSSTLRLCLLS
jgi:hypothetical protein